MQGPIWGNHTGERGGLWELFPSLISRPNFTNSILSNWKWLEKEIHKGMKKIIESLPTSPYFPVPQK